MCVGFFNTSFYCLCEHIDGYDIIVCWLKKKKFSEVLRIVVSKGCFSDWFCTLHNVKSFCKKGNLDTCKHMLQTCWYKTIRRPSHTCPWWCPLTLVNTSHYAVCRFVLKILSMIFYSYLVEHITRFHSSDFLSTTLKFCWTHHIVYVIHSDEIIAPNVIFIMHTHIILFGVFLLWSWPVELL